MGWKGWETFTPSEPSTTSYAAALKPKPSKFRNVPAAVSGRVFQSKKEADRYQVLQARQAAGEIRKLECQPLFVLHTLTPSGEWVEVGRYRPDFRYVEVASGRVTIEDAKSQATKTQAYQYRKRHVEAEYGITVEEV